MTHRKWLLYAGAALSICALGFASRSVKKAALDIQPGPTVMSPEELAITDDASAGMQHGVILVEETVRDDSGSEVRLAHHTRAKILSNEARGLADITIPFNSASGSLKKWWGRTIHPDGSVLELGKDELREQTLVKIRGTRVRVLKAALPGVEPGCVIDYGYVLRGGPFFSTSRIHLQRQWPVREFRYQWFPYLSYPSQYFVRRRPNMDFNIMRGKGAVMFEGKNLPLYVDEPWAPPDDVVRAGATLFYEYSRTSEDPNTFWDDVARGETEGLRAFLKKDKPLEKTLASMQLPPGAPLEEKLQAVYAWLDANIKNRSLLTAEEREKIEEKRESKKWRARAYAAREKNTAADVLARAEGYASQIRSLFVGFARALGAHADLVMACDRDYRFWEKKLLTADQLDYRLVAVRAPGAPDEEATLVAPGSGLPYGMIPWWLTPTRALRVTSSGAREMWLPHSAARQNVFETRATIAFAEDNSTARVDWTAKGAGERHYLDRLILRLSKPEKREDDLERQCGAGGDLEVLEAKAPDLADYTAPYRLACQGELVDLDIDESEDEFLFEFRGPWIPSLPEFSSPTRVHPVFFRYPFIDLTTVEVASPAGFTPRQPPPLVRFQTPFGTYGRKITKTAGGYRVERAVALLALTVKAEDYKALRAFLERIRVADHAMLEFGRKKEAS
ncbi:MAG: DUF3857 domain-containing protein [Acidobacteriota bacterium]